MPTKLYPEDFHSRLTESKRIDTLWEGNHDDNWTNCFGLIFYIFFPEILEHSQRKYHHTHRNPRQYYLPLHFSNETNPLADWTRTTEALAYYNLKLANFAHFLTVEQLTSGTHNYVHAAIVSPGNDAELIQRPAVNVPIEDAQPYQQALKRYLQPGKWPKHHQNMLPFIIKFWCIDDLLVD